MFPSNCELRPPLLLQNVRNRCSTVLITSTALHHNWTVPLVNQTQQFLTWIEPEFRQHLKITQHNTLVAIWIGINDIGDTSKRNVSFPDLYDDIISTMFTESVDPLYATGYRNFLFVNLPPQVQDSLLELFLFPIICGQLSLVLASPFVRLLNEDNGEGDVCVLSGIKSRIIK